MIPSPDIVVLTETNLCLDIIDPELGLSDYCIYRRDRYNYSNPPQGGGVLIAVRSNLNFKSSRLSVDDEGCEQLFIEICLNDQDFKINNKLIVGTVYLPPRSEEVKFRSYVSVLETLR